MIFKETHKQRDEDMFTPWLKINCPLIQFELAFVLVDNCACLGNVQEDIHEQVETSLV